MAKRAAALVKTFDEIEVVAICGRNGGLEAKLQRLANSALFFGSEREATMARLKQRLSGGKSSS